jgi:hypothetical protein
MVTAELAVNRQKSGVSSPTSMSDWAMIGSLRWAPAEIGESLKTGALFDTVVYRSRGNRVRALILEFASETLL